MLNKQIIGKVCLVISILIWGSSVAFAGTIDDMLLTAIASNNLDLAKTAIANGANVNYIKPNHYTPLTLAVKNKNANLVSLLLNNGADPNLKMDKVSYFDTPLIFAVQNDDLKITQILVEAGADVNIPREKKDIGLFNSPSPNDGSTPLIFAIQKELGDWPSVNMVNFLISKGADANQSNEHGYTPLMASAEYKYGKQQQTRCQIARILLQSGADPIRQTNKGKTALQYAVDTNFVEMINLLLPILPK